MPTISYQIPHSIQVYRSIDWGFFPDPAYCLWILHLGNRYIAFKEKSWFKTVASEVAKDIVEESEGMRIVTTFCDPTMDIQTGADIRTIKDTFEMNGVPMECSINNREHFAHAVHTALVEEAEPGIPRLQIYDGGKYAGCPYLLKTLPQQRYDPKHPLKLANHPHDHPTVALAYFLISSGAMEHRSATNPSPLRRWQQPKNAKQWVLGNEGVQIR
jgi:hypothetical protein